MTVPGSETAARGRVRACDADREQAITTLQAATGQGRLTGDEFTARVDQAYAARTYAELAEVTADIPVEPAPARAPRDPWRATRLAWRSVYVSVVPAIVTLVVLPAGPGHPSRAVVTTTAVFSYLLLWLFGLLAMIGARKTAAARRRPGSAAASPALARRYASRVDRVQAINTLRAAHGQGRLTEDEYGARARRADAARNHAELAALTADLPPESAAVRPPTAADARIGSGLVVAAATLLGLLLWWQPGGAAGFMTAFLAATTIVVGTPVAAGLLADVRRQAGEVRRQA